MLAKQQQEKDPQQWQRELEKNLRPLTQKLNELAQRPADTQSQSFWLTDDRHTFDR